MVDFVNIGNNPNDGTGDTLRVAFSKINNAFQSVLEEIEDLGGNSLGQDKTLFTRQQLTSDYNLEANDTIRQHLIIESDNVNVNLPSSPVNGTQFLIKNYINSSFPFTINSVQIYPGEFYEVAFDGVEWVEM